MQLIYNDLYLAKIIHSHKKTPNKSKTHRFSTGFCYNLNENITIY